MRVCEVNTVRSCVRILALFCLVGVGCSTPSTPSTPLPSGEPTLSSPYGKSWAVVIGIDKYRHARQLKYAVNDAVAMRDLLRAQGFHVRELLDSDATKIGIEALLGDDLRRTVGSSDRLLVFFAGHGVTDLGRNREEEGYLLPVDGDASHLFSTAISMKALREIADRIAAKHVLFVIDACYSGYAIYGRGASSQLVEELLRKQGVQILTAGGKEHEAQERDGHGIFTDVLVRGLRGEAFTDKAWLSLDELAVWLKPRVYAESGRKQIPQAGNLTGEGQFVFFHSGASGPKEVARPDVSPSKESIKSPTAITIANDGKALYVLDQRAGELAIVSRATNTVDTKIRLRTADHPRSVLEQVVASPNGQEIYVSDSSTGVINVIDTTTAKVVSQISAGQSPRFMAITRDGGKIYVTNDRTIGVIDVGRRQLVKIVGGVNCPQGVALSRDGRRLYIASQCGNGQDPLFVIDTATEQVIEKETVPGLAVGLTVVASRETRKVYVLRGNVSPDDSPRSGTGGGSAITAILWQLGGNAVRKSDLVLPGAASAMTLTPDGHYLLAGIGDSIHVIDTTSDRKVDEVPLRSSPSDIAVAQDGSVYVALTSEGQLFSFGLSGLAVSAMDEFRSPTGTVFRREGDEWVEHSPNDPGKHPRFYEFRRDSDFIYLKDVSRHRPDDAKNALLVRLPIRGGSAQRSYEKPISWIDLMLVESVRAASKIWSTRAAMPAPPRGGVASGVSDGVLYIAGGCCPGLLAANDAYDAAADTWMTKASLRVGTASANGNGGIVNDVFYVMGGNTGGSSCANTVQAYDLTTDTWTFKAPMPIPRCDHAMAVVNGLIYVFGGRTGFAPPSALAAVNVYNPRTDSWSSATSMPTARNAPIAVTFEGGIYVIGGTTLSATGGTALTTNEVYHIATNTWAPKAPMPTARSNMARGVIGGRIYVAGGDNGWMILATNESYDPSTDRWRTEISLPEPRAGAASGVVEGKLYVVGGGAPGGTPVRSNYVFTP